MSKVNGSALTVEDALELTQYEELALAWQDRVKAWGRDEPLSNVFSAIASKLNSAKGGKFHEIQLSSGECLFVQIDPELEHRYILSKRPGTAYKLLQDGRNVYLGFRPDGARCFMPMARIDHDECLRLGAKLSDSSEILYPKPVYRYSIQSSFSPVSFSDVFSSIRRSEDKSVKLDGKALMLSIKPVYIGIVETMSMSGIDYALELVDVGDDVYRLDFRHTDIIGGQSICFVNCRDIELDTFFA
ncbi:hypothetical protein [Vibrio owensii]|uniref:hypothetical protein n=1 Tax=Vibrio owensii TaxID=696485 RepID=UPI0018F13E63|nr:hypothetical protein [Vibrio owensii]